jgi:hypothetical protein
MCSLNAVPYFLFLQQKQLIIITIISITILYIKLIAAAHHSRSY